MATGNTSCWTAFKGTNVPGHLVCNIRGNTSSRSSCSFGYPSAAPTLAVAAAAAEVTEGEEGPQRPWLKKKLESYTHRAKRQKRNKIHEPKVVWKFSANASQSSQSVCQLQAVFHGVRLMGLQGLKVKNIHGTLQKASGTAKGEVKLPPPRCRPLKHFTKVVFLSPWQGSC